jgi:ABC-type amino acid transport system permease subunit
MDTAAILEMITGPFAALILSIGILYWLATKILPILQRYLEDRAQSLEI